MLSSVAFYEVGLSGSPCTLVLCSWFASELLFSSWGFYFDSVSTLLLLVISGVSCFVHFYAVSYMAHDPHQNRFMSYLSLFTAFMIFLVTADNFVVMFFGWEGVGLASFLLIGFWNNRVQAGKSAIKAMLVNRFGDLGLVLGICSVFLTFKTLDYLVIFALVPCAVTCGFSFFSFDFDKLTVISLLLFWGAVGKSAQIGLHIWLPDAMEGPTPVSALIHAATLVTAGVFLLIRCSALFENSPKTLLVVTFVGAFTSLFASTVGLVQNDLKRVIAYSTCSQLGYMVFSAGLSSYSAALFHLANHALFKALLFLSAGCIIHGLSDEQDMRKMGGVIQLFPVSYAMVLIGSLALVGFPFLAGFYSKDAILEAAFATCSNSGNFAFFLGCCAAFCTSFYSFRLILLTFVNRTNGFKNAVENAHEAPYQMLAPLLFLSSGSVFWGFLSRDMLVGVGTPFFCNSVFCTHKNCFLVDSEFLHILFKNTPLFFTVFGALLSFFFINCFNFSKDFVFYLKTNSFFRTFYTFLIQKWHFDQLVNDTIVAKTMNFGYKCSFQLFDKELIEFFGPSGFGALFGFFSKGFSFFQSGLLYHYSFVMFFSVICAIFVVQHSFFEAFGNSFFLLFFSYVLISLRAKT
jgi:proton-translocating NADH-quinone oxidoreductase chain L